MVSCRYFESERLGANEETEEEKCSFVACGFFNVTHARLRREPLSNPSIRRNRLNACGLLACLGIDAGCRRDPFGEWCGGVDVSMPLTALKRWIIDPNLCCVG